MSPSPGRMGSRDGRHGLLILAAVAVVAGAVLIGVAVSHRQSAPPAPDASAFGHIASRGPSAPAAGATTAADPSTSPTTGSVHSSAGRLTLASSTPTRIDIAAIGVHSPVISLGKDSTGALAVPQPGPDLDKVAWYEGSPTPGEAGPAVLEGHVDTVQGPSVFYRLGDLHPGDRITISRRDGSAVVFTVNAVRAYATHEDFPARQIFGGDLSASSLRLITCSNFDQSIGHYLGNTVVFAHLSSVRPA